MPAKERFNEIRDSVQELHEVQLSLSVGGEEWHPDTVRSVGLSDPTANKAIYNIDILGDVLESLRKREEELVEQIGSALVIIHAVRRSLGDEYAEILEQRYIDLKTWDCIEYKGETMPKSTAKLKASVSFDWIDSVGWSNIAKGKHNIL